MKTVRLILALLYIIFPAMAAGAAESTPETITNPILPGFNPDPSICRVDDDYYMVTSSFAWYPGLPIYHSRDLANWELIGHAVDENNIGSFHFEKSGDNDGLWAPTIRHHDGKFYISAHHWRAGGNFIITADNAAGPWSDPVWVPEASGIDPTIFWDNDGKSYYLGNCYDFKQQWSGQVGVFIQEIDLSHTVERTIRDKKTGISFIAPAYNLLGERKILTYGHATNASYAEGPHIYHIDDNYYLLIAEGGSSKNHAVTMLRSHSLFGPYKPQAINPVLSHRQMGDCYPIQNIGHADLFQTQYGDWYAICLGNRMVPNDGSDKCYCPLGRETWLTPVKRQGEQFVFAPNEGRVTMELKRPELQWSPVTVQKDVWYTPMTLKNARIKKIKALAWMFEREIMDNSDEKGIILFRTVNSYYALLKEKGHVILKKADKGVESIVADVPYSDNTVNLKIEADNLNLNFYCNGRKVGETQSMIPLCDDGNFNKFNGTGVGYLLNSKK